MAADFQTVAGTKLYVAEALPTVTSGAGAAAAFALLTWLEVGELTQIPSVKGRTYSTSTASTIGDAQEREKKGSFKLPNAQFECLWVEDDAGQIVVETAANNYDILSFKLVKQDGAIRYLTAQIMEFLENNGASNDSVKGQFTLLRQTDTVTA